MIQILPAFVYAQLSLDLIRRSVNIAFAIWMYFIFIYCQYDIWLLKSALSLQFQGSDQQTEEFDLPGQRQRSRMKTGFLTKGVIMGVIW